MTATDRDVTRLETLSDGVFAFSATLLVVSLEVPRRFTDLVANLYGFIAFGLTFIALVLIWSVHRAFFRRYALNDSWTLIFNSTLLFVILFYVFPLKFVAQALIESLGLVPATAVRTDLGGIENLSTLFIIYGGGFAALFLCVALMYRHAHRMSKHLGLSTHEEREARFLFRHYSIFVVVALLSIGLALLDVGLRWGTPGFAYVLLGPLCYGHGKLSKV
jgi:uncharacterized membrane protein